jgi:hypothetical protein
LQPKASYVVGMYRLAMPHTTIPHTLPRSDCTPQQVLLHAAALSCVSLMLRTSLITANRFKATPQPCLILLLCTCKRCTRHGKKHSQSQSPTSTRHFVNAVSGRYRVGYASRNVSWRRDSAGYASCYASWRRDSGHYPISPPVLQYLASRYVVSCSE